MGLSTRVNGGMDYAMEREPKCGRTAHDTKVNGSMTLETAMVSLPTPMVKSTLATGRTAFKMELELIRRLMDLIMKASSRMDASTAKAYSPVQTVHVTKASMKTIRDMGRGAIPRRTAATMREISTMIYRAEMASTTPRVGGITGVTGRRERCT